MDFRIPNSNQYRCSCGRLVRISNTYRVKIRTSVRIDGELTPVENTRRVCAHCKQILSPLHDPIEIPRANYAMVAFMYIRNTILRYCKASDCAVQFQINNSHHRYCSSACRDRSYSRDRYLLNPKESNAAVRKSYRKHRDKQLKQSRDRYHNNIEKERARTKLYQYLNPDKQRVRSLKSDRKRKALKYGYSPDLFTAADWEKIKEDWKFKCAYCGCIPQTLTQDHVIPLSKGGPHSKSNILPVCKPCNCRKNDRDLYTFLLEIYK